MSAIRDATWAELIGMGLALGTFASMLAAMLLMTVAFWAYTFAVVLMRARAIALEQEGEAERAGPLRRAIGRAT